MKKTMIYSIAFSLAIFLTGVTQAFAHKGEPKRKHKKVIVQKPKMQVVYNRPAVVRSGYVWVNGHYRWNQKRHSYVWISGRYIKQKRGKIWTEGRWTGTRGGWYYQPGSWQRVQRF